MAAFPCSRLREGGCRPQVGVDFHTFDGIFQGSRSHVLGIFREAIRLAPEIDFILFLDNPEQLKSAHPEFGAPNVRLVRMPHRPGPIRLGLQLPWLQVREKLDLLHTQYRLPFFPLGPCACTIHDVLFESHPEYFPRFFTLQSKLTFRLAARVARLLFSVSEFSRKEIAARFGIEAERIRVLYNGVDRARFFPGREGVEKLAPLGLDAGGYLLTVGRLEPRKNHARLIEAFGRLGEGAPPLVCVGQRDFGYAAALEAATRFGVQGRVHFLENVGDDMLPVLMRNARAFVFPAIAEGFGMPVAEALASGVPVVTSNTTSMPEVAGRAAVLVDPLDVTSIAQGLEKVLGDPELAATMVTEGAEQIKKFDWAESARALVASYRGFFADRYATQGAPSERGA
ncbi:glycosyltransferase family 1 protein [Aromatoleum evansii]|uniref:Glycosyltransferase family 1 protein n=1 Tax=Aromatoleum evansii TaxID=59406 RepID=A0ABZ1AU04_AROEV|nr:glycosyltransferase family 1 protein [Aromatoleum evansii]